MGKKSKEGEMSVSGVPEIPELISQFPDDTPRETFHLLSIL